MTAEDVDPSTLEGGLDGYGGGAVIACCVIFAVSCTAFLALRFTALHVGRRRISMEDWIMIPAWVLMMGLCATGICGVQYGGVGRHEAWVLEYIPKAMVSWAQTLFVTEFIYGILIPLEKTSILLLYLRLFDVYRWFRFLTIILIAYIWMWGISESIVAVVQCTPVAYQWDRSIVGGKCIDQLAYFRWVSVPNVIHDVVMLVAPVPVVWKLQIQWQQKLALSAVFVIGSFGCVASFIRMYYFFQLNAFSDRTWASIQLLSWTIAEPGVILICACMPALWPLVRHIPGLSGMLRLSRGKRSTAPPAGGSGPDSKHRGSAYAWSTPSRGRMSRNEDFIPLNDVDEHVQPPTYHVSTSTLREGPQIGEAAARGTGISVTREFIVTSPD